AGVHDSPCALHGARQTAARARAARGWRHEPPEDSERIQPVPSRPDDLGRDGFDAARLHLLYDQPRDAGQVRNAVAVALDSVSVVWNSPLPLPRASAGRRRQPCRTAPLGSTAARVRRFMGADRSAPDLSTTVGAMPEFNF